MHFPPGKGLRRQRSNVDHTGVVNVNIEVLVVYVVIVAGVTVSVITRADKPGPWFFTTVVPGLSGHRAPVSTLPDRRYDRRWTGSVGSNRGCGRDLADPCRSR